MGSDDLLEIPGGMPLDAPRMYARKAQDMLGLMEVILVNRYTEWSAARMAETICQAAEQVDFPGQNTRVRQSEKFGGLLYEAVARLSHTMRRQLSSREPSAIELIYSKFGSIDERLYTHDELDWVSIQSGRMPSESLYNAKCLYQPNHYIPIADMVGVFHAVSSELGWRYFTKLDSQADQIPRPVMSQSWSWNGTHKLATLEERHKKEIIEIAQIFAPIVNDGGYQRLIDKTSILMQDQMVRTVRKMGIHSE